MLIISLTIAWLTGLWLASTMKGDAHVWMLAGSLCWIAAFLGRAFFFRRTRHQTWPLSIGLAHLGISALAGGYYIVALPVVDTGHIAYYNGQQEVVVTGLVIDEPDIRDQNIFLRVEAENIILAGGQLRPLEGLILVQVPRFPVIPYGAQIQLSGTLESPVSSPTFDYKSYLARQNIHSQMNWPRLTVLAEEQGSFLYHTIYTLKDQAHRTILQLLPDPQAALLSGILLGNDRGLSPELLDQFRTTGITHIIAISG